MNRSIGIIEQVHSLESSFVFRTQQNGMSGICPFGSQGAAYITCSNDGYFHTTT
jgi:hypothetical protein